MRKMWYLVPMAFLAGCYIFSSPYDHSENWLIRENAMLTFAVQADVFYVQSDLYTSKAKVPLMAAYAYAEVGRGRFSGVARVFSPLIASEDDLEEAVNWYLWHHHKSGFPLIFIGEGKGGAWLQQYEKDNAESLKENGLVASFYTDAARKGFVNSEMVRKIKAAITRARYKSVWDKDMPPGMLD